MSSTTRKVACSELVPRPRVKFPIDIVRRAIQLSGVEISEGCAQGLRALLECVISEWIIAAAQRARGSTLDPEHFRFAVVADEDLALVFPGIVSHTGGSQGENILAFSHMNLAPEYPRRARKLTSLSVLKK